MAETDPNQEGREFGERLRDQIQADVYNRMQARMERRHGRPGGFFGLFGGLILAGIGILLLLQNLGVMYIADVWKYWPVILIAFGLSRAVSACSTGVRVVGALISLAGVVFLLGNLGVIRSNVWSYFWPVILIAIGVAMLARSLQRNRRRAAWTASPTAPAANPFPASPGRVSAYAIFSGVKRRVVTQEFEGGEVLAIMGGIQLDLRDAAMKSGEAVLDASTIFGGVEIRVPDTWVVSVHGTGILGGYEDATVGGSGGPPRQAGKCPHLIINGYAVLGGVSVK